MSETIESTGPISNRILAALSVKAYQIMLPKMQRITLVFAEHIYQPAGIIRQVYFPESGIISVLSVVGANSALEVGIVGNEGMVGLPLFLGVKTSNILALVQGAGCRFADVGGRFSRRMRSQPGIAATSAALYTFAYDTNVAISGLQSFSSN